jgi:hypothetical protein
MRKLGLSLSVSLSVSVAFGLFGCNAAPDATASTTQNETGATICSPELQALAVDRMIHQPIKAPRFYAGIDLAGGDAWKGLTYEEATQTLCQAKELDGDDFGKNVQWGPNGEVSAGYNPSTHKIEFVQMNAGYQGKLEFNSRKTSLSDPTQPNPFGQHTYSIGVGTPIMRDGAVFELDWFNIDRQATELYDALMATFAPELPSTQDNCKREQSCRAALDGGNGASFGARPLGVYFHIAAPDAKPPVTSTPDFLYAFLVKMTPFTFAETFFKLDAEGPTAIARDIGDRQPRATCAMKLGLPFQDFVDDCIDILTDPQNNEHLKQKVLGSANRVQDTWRTDVTGIAPNFTAQSPGETGPAPSSTLNELVFDVRASGKSANEYSRDGRTLTMAGTAAIYREYARLVQDALHAAVDPSLPKFPIGAPECLLPANGDPATWHPASGCTGMEAFITPAQADTGDAGIDRVSVGAQKALSLGITSAMKVATLNATFCADPGAFAHCGRFDANNVQDVLGMSGPLFKASADRVAAILGDATPKAARVPLFYLRLFAHAQVKYLRAAASYPTDLSQPEFSQFEPSPSDITIVTTDTDEDVVKYKNAFEYTVLEQSANVQGVTFRR